ncbi:MAG: hypothetical protein KC613_27025, partial [Myxococcales bacterium]|nr:hypothetical protein [Myxococcales bacterium]
GICGPGLFCLNDSLNRDDETGAVVPYCTTPCGDDRSCADGYQCVDVPPSSQACQKIPSAGDRNVGDACWVDPRQPSDPDTNRPSCGEGLECVGYRFDPVTMELIDRGRCTKQCDAQDCCPVGWGCQPVTAVFALCAEGMSDGEGLECTGERPGLEPPDPVETKKSGGDDGGCRISWQPSGPWGPAAFALLVGLIGLRSRRRRP